MSRASDHAPASRSGRPAYPDRMTEISATTAAAPSAARKPRASLSWRYRGAVALRTLAATVIGYLVAYGFTAFATVVLPFGRNDRVIGASLLCFFVWCAAAMYAFAARSAWRACWVLALWAAAMYAVAWMFPEAAARP